MTFANRPVVSLSLRLLCILVFLVPLGCDDGDDPVLVPIEINFDFVEDLEFPPGEDREWEYRFDFPKSGITVRATAFVDEDGMAARVSRRRPGGLGVEGNGGTEPDGGETSGNRINNGELLILEVFDDSENPVSVQLVGVTFSRIKHFAGEHETGFEIIADNDGAFAVEIEGTLDPSSDDFVGIEDQDTGDVLIDIEDVEFFGDMFTFTNGRPFDPTANRYRVGGVTILVEE